MGIRTLTTARSSLEDEAENQCESISQLVSRLRTAFRTEDFDLVEEKLVAREVKLKREIEKMIAENAVLEGKHQFDQLEKLQAEDQRNAANERYGKLLEEVKGGVHVEELRRKNDELEREKKGLEALLNRKCTEWEASITRLEAKMERLIDEQRRGSRNMEGTAENDGMIVDINYENCSLTSSPVIDLKNALELCGNGSMGAIEAGPSLSDHLHSKGSGDHQTSGVRKFSTGGTVLMIDSDEDDCTPTETALQKITSGKPIDNNYLSMTSVEENTKWVKRKRAPSVSTSDNENGGDNFELENTSIREMTQRLKSSLEPSGSLVNHSVLNDPKNCDLELLTDEEKMWAQQRSQEFLRSRSLAEVNEDCDSTSSSSSSSSDSEDGNGYMFSPSVADALEKVRATQECSP